MRAGDALFCKQATALLLAATLRTHHERRPMPRAGHHWCVHSDSYNGSDKVRQAIISRFHTTRWGEEQAKDAGGAASDGNLWRYWTPEVGGTADAAKL